MREHTRSLRLPFIILPMALALAGCDATLAQPDYIGGVYSGSVMAEVDDGGPINKRQYGRATAELKRTAAGKARLTVKGDISGESAGFAIEGSYDNSGFFGRDSEIELTIDATGKISGQGAAEGSEYLFAGTISGTDLALTMQWRPAAGAPPSPLQSIEFTYTLENDATENGSEVGDGPTDENGKPCTKTRVEQRAFPSFDGGPMTMGMVIVCDD